MSIRRSVSRSEGIDQIRLDTSTHARLHCLDIDDIRGAGKQLANCLLHADIVVNRRMPCFIQLDRDIDVTFGPGVAARQGAEQACMPDAELFELGPVGAQHSDDGVLVHAAKIGGYAGPFQPRLSHRRRTGP